MSNSNDSNNNSPFMYLFPLMLIAGYFACLIRYPVTTIIVTIFLVLIGNYEEKHQPNTGCINRPSWVQTQLG